MMELIFKIATVFVFLNIKVDSSVVINRYDDDKCVLDKKLVAEIASYKDVTKNIMEDIKRRGSGEKMYQE